MSLFQMLSCTHVDFRVFLYFMIWCFVKNSGNILFAVVMLAKLWSCHFWVSRRICKGHVRLGSPVVVSTWSLEQSVWIIICISIRLIRLCPHPAILNVAYYVRHLFTGQQYPISDMEIAESNTLLEYSTHLYYMQYSWTCMYWILDREKEARARTKEQTW